MTEIMPTAIIGPAIDRPAAGAVALPDPMVRTVGDIVGLSPRRTKGDGGEVPGADVDTVDALPEREWSTVAAWLKAGKTVSTRRARLADVAAFCRWLDTELPGVGLLAVSEDHLNHYRDQLGTGQARAGVARPGKALSAATVARRLSSLSSLYAYAIRRRMLATNPAEPVDRPEVSTVGTTPARTVTEQTALVDGAEAIAAEHPVDAAAVALLAVCALRVGELVALTIGQVRDDAGHCVIVFRRKGGTVDRVPVPPRVCALLDPLREGRAADALLFTRQDGRPFDRWRMTTALRRAATAAGVDAKGLTPHTARATAATALLDAKVPLADVQELLGHASPVTTKRYDRGRRKLDGHAAYRMASILAGGS
ncbi:hypothetical protein E1286_37180 [Nonomuraea terrae]|uniref:Integrase n=1 Tax=Nonomuraea terrae TaxID=2530383 RepID=A0A4R4Y0H9_9ACTN|nr:tyrosine-type recombinase/integrase [Nonomuraea terrae]TDD37505.1 hypothetical protein E1286_37180 [Nonomuraea terrae]